MSWDMLTHVADGVIVIGLPVTLATLIGLFREVTKRAKITAQFGVGYVSDLALSKPSSEAHCRAEWKDRKEWSEAVRFPVEICNHGRASARDWFAHISLKTVPGHLRLDPTQWPENEFQRKYFSVEVMNDGTVDLYQGSNATASDGLHPGTSDVTIFAVPLRQGVEELEVNVGFSAEDFHKQEFALRLIIDAATRSGNSLPLLDPSRDRGG